MNGRRTAVSLAVLSLLGAGVTTTATTAFASTATPSPFLRPAHPDAVKPANTNPAPAVRAKAVSQALAALRGTQTSFAGTSDDTYTPYTVAIDWTGVKHVRFERSHHGLPVEGGQVIVELAPDGSKIALTSEITQPIAVSTTPTLTPARAQAAARGQLADGVVTTMGAPRLVVAAPLRQRPRLAWDTLVQGFHADHQTPAKLHVVTDAATGALIWSHDEIETAEGTGKGIYNKPVKIQTTQNGNGYELVDPTHGNGQTTNLNHATDGNGDVFTNSSNDWGTGDNSDPASAGVDSHFGAGETWDFYKATENRDGVFGDGRGVPSRDHYGDNFENAFWDGQQMTYGDGQGNANPLTEIDVSGHEMSHGVTGALVNWSGGGDSGGMNEGSSDIFGTMVEFYANIPSNPPNYTIGELINFHGDGKPLRYMYHPSLDGKSPDCYNAGSEPSDPHLVGGPLNHWFFLLSEGSGDTKFGDSPTCDNSTLKGIGRDKAAKIWYQALASHANSNEDYPAARTDSIAAANDLFGADSAEAKAVDAAWKAVGVGG